LPGPIFGVTGTDVPIRVNLFDVLKSGEIMTAQKSETFLGHCWPEFVAPKESARQHPKKQLIYAYLRASQGSIRSRYESACNFAITGYTNPLIFNKSRQDV
jgi:hypothetical protein